MGDEAKAMAEFLRPLSRELKAGAIKWDRPFIGDTMQTRGTFKELHDARRPKPKAKPKGGK